MSIVLAIVATLAEFGFTKVADKILTNKETFTEHLVKVIEKTIEEYKVKNQINNNGNQILFYDSQIFLEELLKLRLFGSKKTFSNESFINDILASNPNILLPTNSELDAFFVIFDNLIKIDEELRKLEIEEFYKVAIFDILEQVYLINQNLKKIGNHLEIENKVKSEYSDKLLNSEANISDNGIFSNNISPKINNDDLTMSFKEVEIISASNELQVLYENDEIHEGIEKADYAFAEYGINFGILRHIFRFNMRVKNWNKIRTIIETLNFNELSDEVNTLCKLALFECEVREAISVFKSDRTEHNKKLLNAKKYLNQVPHSQYSYGEFLYWNGRWFLELWYSCGGTDITHLKQALFYFEKALSKQYRWWYHCYKCIILKLLNNFSFENEVLNYTNIMIEEIKKQPYRPSVRTYTITAYLLNDDVINLEKLLIQLNIPSTAIDFQSTIFHHLEFIYYFDRSKQKKYKNILENWIANLPLK